MPRDFIVRIDPSGHTSLMTLPDTDEEGLVATDEERRRAVAEAERILRENFEQGKMVVKVPSPREEAELVQPHDAVDLKAHHYEIHPIIRGG